MSTPPTEEQAPAPATDVEKAEAERLKEQKEIKQALKQTAPRREPSAPETEKASGLWFGSYVLLLIALFVIYYVLELGLLTFLSTYLDILLKLTRILILSVLVLTSSQALDIYAISHIENTAYRYNLRRVLKLAVVGLIIVITISILSLNIYAAFASLGLFSLIVGLALQSTLTSFFGWVYILLRQPYRVGDRIKIGDAHGDVIEVGYLDTTLWEFGGPYLSTDHPSGRIIKFPNSQVLNSPVYNYSWPLFPYIWDEIKFQIAYDSDLEFVGRTMQQVAEEEIGEFMMERVRVYRQLLAQTPVDELQIQERPTVHFRVNDNTWLEAIVRYLVQPKEKGRVKTRLIKKLLARLNAEPDRALFPKSNMR